MKDVPLSKLRSEAEALLRENYALAILAQATDTQAWADFNKGLSSIASGSRALLLKQITGSKELIARLRDHLKCQAQSATLLELLSACLDAPGAMHLQLSKRAVAKLCGAYEHVLPSFPSLPSYATIAMNTGATRSQRGLIEIRMVDATACEDMCALYNLAETYSRRPSADYQVASVRKSANALYRQTILSTQAFLESYLNGAAHEHIARSGGTLTQDVVDELMDWNSTANRPRYLSLRDKLSKYQRRICNVPHAPVQESNCAELRRILEGKDRRDAMTHPSPRSQVAESVTGVRLFIGDVSFDDAKGAVCDVLEVVRRLENAMFGGTSRVEEWLPTMGADGRFAEGAFV